MWHLAQFLSGVERRNGGVRQTLQRFSRGLSGILGWLRMWIGLDCDGLIVYAERCLRATQGKSCGKWGYLNDTQGPHVY